MRFPMSLVGKIMDWTIARTSEEGARQLVWAALAGETGGGDPQLREKLRGVYVRDYSVGEESDWTFTTAGQEAERRIWVSAHN
jgi:retinol dehydrogenase-12